MAHRRGDGIWCTRPFWSPDSQWIYFLGSCGEQSGLCRVAAGGGPAVVVQSGAWSATISPDGKTLVFVARGGQNEFWR